jgi:hypothetical protein
MRILDDATLSSSVRIHVPDTRDVWTYIENDDFSPSGVHYLTSSDAENRRW